MPNLKEICSVGAEIISELLQGKSTDEILSNIDLSDEYLSEMAAAMRTVADADDLAVVLSDGETFTGLQGCSIRKLLDETDAEGSEFGDAVMEM